MAGLGLPSFEARVDLPTFQAKLVRDDKPLQEQLQALRRRYDARARGPNWVQPAEVQSLLAQVNDVRRCLIRDPGKHAGGCRRSN